jgi:hypothetical protein
MEVEVRMKQATTTLLLVSALAFAGCGRSPAAPSTLTSAAPSGVSQGQLAQHASEQVVFSGVASTNSTFPNGSPAGFWIWCEAESENPYDGECNGAMYFYALGITKHVEGEVTEPSEGIYRMDVSSTLDSSIVHCILMNQSAEPLNGPRNTVTVSCTTPSGSATSTTAVVNVTGPPEH